MNYSKAQLEGQNKTQLVDLAIKLQNQVDAVSGKAMTSSEVQKKLLDLQSQVINVESESQSAERNFKLKLEEITADKELAIKKLELEHTGNVGKSAAELKALFEDLETKSEKAKEDLTFGLKEHEIQIEGKIAEINSKLETVSAEYDGKLVELKEKVASETNKANEEIAKIKTTHTRVVEDLEYTNKISIRDKKVEVAEKIAETVGKVLVDAKELASLKEFVESDSESITAKVEEAVSAATAKVYSSEGAKYSSLKSSTEKDIALLTNDKKHLETTATQNAARIADLEARLKEVPGQIAKAVEAAKSNTTVNQQSGK